MKKGKTKVRAKRKAQGAMLMSALYAEYLRDHSSVKKRISSQREDESLWRLHIEPEFGGCEVKRITHSDVDVFISRKVGELRAKGGSGGRANNILALMSSMMNFGRKRRYIKSNPCFGITKLKTEHDWPELSDLQRKSLRASAYAESKMMGLIVDMALITGARKKEILNSRWEEFNGNIWTIPKDRKKGKKEHVLTLPDNLHNTLQEWRNRDGIIDSFGTSAPLVRNTGFVFPSNGMKHSGKFNRKLSRYEGVVPEVSRPALGDIKKPWTRIRKSLNLESFRFHDLRHDFGTQSAKAGVDVFALMNAMGHRRIETTMLYINRAGNNGQKEVLAKREQFLLSISS